MVLLSGSSLRRKRPSTKEPGQTLPQSGRSFSGSWMACRASSPSRWLCILLMFRTSSWPSSSCRGTKSTSKVLRMSARIWSSIVVSRIFFRLGRIRPGWPEKACGILRGSLGKSEKLKKRRRPARGRTHEADGKRPMPTIHTGICAANQHAGLTGPGVRARQNA